MCRCFLPPANKSSALRIWPGWCAVSSSILTLIEDDSELGAIFWFSHIHKLKAMPTQGAGDTYL